MHSVLEPSEASVTEESFEGLDHSLEILEES